MGVKNIQTAGYNGVYGIYVLKVGYSQKNIGIISIAQKMCSVLS